MKKRILAMLLAMCMIVGLLPVVAMAEEATTQPSVTFNYMVKGSSKSIVVNAGDKPQYWITTNSDPDKPTYYYMKDCKATDNWNVKLEYPTGGIPTATLRNATFVEGDSWILQFCGTGTYSQTQTAFAGDVKVILEGTNTATFKSSRPAIRLYTTGTATITGPGSLHINHSLSSSTYGVIHSAGNLVLDNATIDINVPSEDSRVGIGMAVKSGDLTIKGGHLKIDGHNPYPSGNGSKAWSSFRPISYALWVTQKSDGTAGGNVFIQDHADVAIFGGPSNSKVNGTTIAEMVDIEGKLSISESDVLFATTSGTYLKAFGAKAPTVELDFDNGYTVAYYSYGSGSTRCSYNSTTKLPDAPSKATTTSDIANVTMTGLDYFKVTHSCIPGEAQYENVMENAPCSTQKYEVHYCTICGEQVGDKTIVTVPNENVHTPGTPVENVSLRKTVAHDAATDSYPAGYYVMETYCDVCGEFIKTENVPFEAGLFYMSTYGNTGGISETSTTKPHIVLNPGETLYYTTNQSQASTDYPDSWYRAAGSADNWNIKLEYPVGGHPIMTLKGATIKNDAGIFYGIGKYVCGAPLTIVVQEDSIVASRVEGEATGLYNTYNRAMTLRTTADVTITGPGKLTLSGDCYTGEAGILLTYGNLTLDGANIEMFTSAQVWPANNAICAKGADFTVKNSKLKIVGVDVTADGSATAFLSAIRAMTVDGKGGNVTIQDGSQVTAIVSIDDKNDSGLYGVQTDGQFVIANSNVELATAGNVYTSLFNTASKPVLNFTKNYDVTAYKAPATYDTETGILTLPEDTQEVDFVTSTGTGLYYFRVQMTGEIAGTSVTLGNTLDVNFAFDKTIVGTEGYVEFVKGNGEAVKVSLADCVVENSPYYVMTFPGVAAKEMKESIKVTVYDAQGNAVSEAYADSVEEYTLRMLRGEKPKDHTDEQFAAMKTLLVDMLNYGAAAQTFFEYNTDTLVNATLTDDEKALATKTMEELTDELRATTGEGYLGTSFILESDIAMLLAVDKAVTGEGSYALVTFTDHYGNVTTDKRVDAVDTFNTHTQYRFDGLVAADARYDVVWKIYTADGTEPVVTVTDSLEKYIARTVGEYTWMEQIMIYADSAYAYLHFGETNA